MSHVLQPGAFAYHPLCRLAATGGAGLNGSTNVSLCRVELVLGHRQFFLYIQCMYTYIYIYIYNIPTHIYTHIHYTHTPARPATVALAIWPCPPALSTAKTTGTLDDLVLDCGGGVVVSAVETFIFTPVRPPLALTL